MTLVQPRNRFSIHAIFLESTKNMTITVLRTLLAALFIVANLSSASAAGNDKITSAALKLYQIRGEVKAVAADKSEITLHHEPIPGFMDEMTMPFDIRDPHLLDGVNAGDRVSGELTVGNREGW